MFLLPVDVSAFVVVKSVFRCKMREAAVLLTPCVVLCLLLSFSQAARQGQDIRCGGMYVCMLPRSLSVQDRKVLMRGCSPSAHRSLQGSGRWDGVGHLPNRSKENDPDGILQDQPGRQPVHQRGKAAAQPRSNVSNPLYRLHHFTSSAAHVCLI